MELRRGIIVIIVMAAMTTVAILPCVSQEKKVEKDIWIEDEPRGPGGGPGRGGPGRGGRGRGRFELTEEYINQFLKELKESDPAKAKELANLREKDPEKFRDELRKSVREQPWTKRLESWRSRWREEFLEWLGKAAPKEARDLNNLKETDPELYTKKYDLIRRKYQRIYEEGRRNPELAEVLMADLELDERQEVLLKKIKATKNEKEKKQLMSKLEEVVSNKYDLLIRRQQIAYQMLLKRIDELQKELSESIKLINIWQDDKIKAQNVKERIKELTEQSRRLRWR